MTDTTDDLKSPEDAAQLVILTLDTIPKAIKTAQDYQLYMGELATAKTRIGKVEGFFERLRKPFNAALKENREQEKKILEPLQTRYKQLKALCDSFFLTQQAEQRRKQEEENRKNEEKRKAAEAKGKDPDLVKPAKVIESKAPAKVEVAPGVSVSMKMDVHFRLTESGKTSRLLIDEPKTKIYRDEPGAQAIPDNCWQLNHSRLLDMVKAGAKIPGVERIELPGNTVRGQ
jgi:hypothetical protein